MVETTAAVRVIARCANEGNVAVDCDCVAKKVTWCGIGGHKLRFEGPTVATIFTAVDVGTSTAGGHVIVLIGTDNREVAADVNRGAKLVKRSAIRSEELRFLREAASPSPLK
eukprot:scaffold1969_cov206-Pinguiococcus_pyrenoidosus.AAC.4